MTTVFHSNKPNIQWKGKTFKQISYGIKLNNYTIGDDIKQYFKARPMRQYRKEITSTDVKCNPRISLKIDHFDRPGGTQITNCENKGLENTLDIIYENNSCQHPTPNCIPELSAEKNALRRVRSSGMTQNKYKINSRNNYFSSTSQYLNNRNLSFQNNQYFSLRRGDSNVKPGSANALENMYTTNSLGHCHKYVLTQATQFEYTWIDNTTHTVNVPAGEYDIKQLNDLLRNEMYVNYHFFVEIPYESKVFLLELRYNSNTNKITIVSKVANTTIFDTVDYKFPDIDVAEPLSVLDWTNSIPAAPTTINPFITLAGDIAELIGFEGGQYPSATNNTQDQYNQGTKSPKITSSLSQVYYKPNNHQFATQGAVSSSDLIARKKYDTITTTGSSFRTAYGSHTANALAYGVPSSGYTIKDKIGYPMKQTPVFSKYSNIMKRCTVRKFINAI